MSSIGCVMFVVLVAAILPPQACSLWWPWKSKVPSKSHFEDFEAETGLDQLGPVDVRSKPRVIQIGAPDAFDVAVDAGMQGAAAASYVVEPPVVASRYNYHVDHDDDFELDLGDGGGYHEGEQPEEEVELPQPELNVQLEGEVPGG